VKHFFRMRPYAFGAIVTVALVVASLAIHAGGQSKAIRIIYTNDTLGYLEPCGCGGHWEGGLARRATLLAELTKQNPNTVIVESGNIVDLANKLDGATSILKRLNYDAIGIGDTDMRVAPEEFFTASAKNGLTVIDSSLDARKSTVPYVIKIVDGVRVGIVSFGWQPPLGNRDEYTLRKALYSAYREVRGKSDILIVLNQSKLIDRDWIERNGARLGAPDIVVGGIARSGISVDEVVGKTHIVPTSVQGKHLGVVDIEVLPGGELTISVKKTEVAGSVVPDKAVEELVKKVPGSRGFVGQQDFPKEPTPVPDPRVGSGTGKPYYPPTLCRACHLKEYQDWAGSKHARAIETLVAANRAVPECLPCHSEMYRRLQRFTTSTEKVGGVECASCHIDSLPHGMERKNTTTRAKVDPTMCLTCHTKDRSPDYNQGSYFPKITHAAKGNSETFAK